MKTIVCLLGIFLALPTWAENLKAELKNQSVHVVKDTVAPTSCRLYRKRIEMFLQRLNEAAMASAVGENRVTAQDATRVLGILQRANLPLDLLKENIFWTLDFDISKAAGFLNKPGLLIEVDSTYLQWQTSEGLFPDHFQVSVSSDLQLARVTYKMTYMEACLAPVAVAMKLTADPGNSIQMQTQLNRDLL